MTQPTISLAYRKASLQQASTVGLVIALYDTLVGNLGRAAAAMERNEIEARCAELTHGFKILHQLELMIDLERGGQAAINLRRFYTHLRGQMLSSQFQLSPSILHKQMKLIIDVREAWQQVDGQDTQRGDAGHAARTVVPQHGRSIHQQPFEAESAHSSFSCSG